MSLQHIILASLLLLLSACSNNRVSTPFQPLPEGEFSVVVEVQEIECCDGVLRLALYNDSQYWLSKTDLARGRLGFIQGESQIFELHGLPAGEYAVAVYQDLDSNNKLDRFLGLIPKEPYGFSNNVAKFGPASFEKAAFTLNADKNITIRLNSH